MGRIAHGRRLEGVEQRTLPARQMLAGGAHLADGFKNLLQQRELVWRERVVGDEFGGVPVATQSHRIARESELIVYDVAFAGEGIAQSNVGGLRLGQ